MIIESTTLLAFMAASVAVYLAPGVDMAFLAVFFGRIGDRFQASPAFQAWQRRITGSAFIGFAGLLALADLRR